MAQQRRGASVGARRRLHVMGIEDQPAVFGGGFVERMIYSLAVDFHLDQRRGAQVLQVHGAAVDAGKNAAGRTEGFAEPPLVRQRSEAIGIREILDSDRGIERRDANHAPRPGRISSPALNHLPLVARKRRPSLCITGKLSSGEFLLARGRNGINRHRWCEIRTSWLLADTACGQAVRSSPCPVVVLSQRYPSQLRKIAVAAVPAAIS